MKNEAPVTRETQESCLNGSCGTEAGSTESTPMTWESTPRVDILETAEEFRVEADLPGVRPDEVDVDLENGILRIQGRARVPSSNGTRDRIREFGPGVFTRSFRLGESIDVGKITAESKNGLLTLRLPKVSEVKPRSIPVASTS
jgi:HSP20 family protein